MAFFTKKNMKKCARYALSGVLVTGMVFITGFLSFTGMLVLNGSIYLAIGAFLLSGGIEGEVYAQNIPNSILKSFWSEYWEDVVLQALLNQLIESSPTSPFLQEYKALQNYIHALEESDDPHSQALALKNAKRSLKYKMDYFKHFMLSDEDSSNTTRFPFHAELNTAFGRHLKKEGKKNTPADIREEILQVRQTIARKTWRSRLAWILIAGAGVSCFFVGLEVAQVSISALAVYFGIAISSAALSASIFGIAIVGAIGYMMLIHNTITDMIKNETLSRWATKTVEFFQRREGETTGHYALRLTLGSIAVAIVVGLGIFATIATAGTWWHAAKAGAQLIPWISAAASELRTIAVSLMGLTTLIFNVVNSLKSVQELAAISLQNVWKHLKKTINKYFTKENLVQLLNPFRLAILLITVPFKLAVFIGHLLSMGIMGDKLDNVDPIATTLLATANEALQDVHYFLPEDEHHGHHHGHSHGQETYYDIQLHTNLSSAQKLKKTFVITQEPAELVLFDAHGHKKIVFSEGEMSEALTSLDLCHYLTQTPNAELPSIKQELSKEKLQALNKLINQKMKKGQQGHEEEEEHDHHHADLVGKFLNFVLTPLYFLAAIWDYVFSQFNMSKEKPNLSFTMANQKSLSGFNPHSHSIKKPKLSASWQQYEKEKRIEKTLAKAATTLSDEGQTTLKEFEKQASSPPPTVGKFDYNALLTAVLAQHPHLKDKDKTQATCQKILQLAAKGSSRAEGEPSTRQTSSLEPPASNPRYPFWNKKDIAQAEPQPLATPRTPRERPTPPLVY